MSSTINTQDSKGVVERTPALLYPTLLIAGIAVIIVSMLGIAAMTGLLPQAQSQLVDERATGGNNAKPGANAKTTNGKTAAAKTPGSKTAPPAVAVALCTDCGVIDSVRAVEVKGEGSGVGAGAGAYAGNEVEKNMKKSISYEIRVRMDDNTYRTFHAAQPDVGVGQRVKVRDGQLVSAG